MLCSNDKDDERIYTFYIIKIVIGRSIEEKKKNKIN